MKTATKKIDRRKEWYFHGCRIVPQSGEPRYFGCKNFKPDSRCPQYYTRWWIIYFFTDKTHVLCATKKDCMDYIGEYIAHLQEQYGNDGMTADEINELNGVTNGVD